MVLEMSSFTAISLELAYLEFKERYISTNDNRIQTYLQSKTETVVATTDEEEKKEPATDPTPASSSASKFYKKA